jgi:hypothetical protein
MSKRILILSPVIAEEVREKAKAELEKERLSAKQKDIKNWERYKKYLSYLKRKRKLIYNGLNTTK